MKCNHCNFEVADGTKIRPYCRSPMAFQQQHLSSYSDVNILILPPFAHGLIRDSNSGVLYYSK